MKRQVEIYSSRHDREAHFGNGIVIEQFATPNLIEVTIKINHLGLLRMSDRTISRFKKTLILAEAFVKEWNKDIGKSMSEVKGQQQS